MKYVLVDIGNTSYGIFYLDKDNKEHFTRSFSNLELERNMRNLLGYLSGNEITFYISSVSETRTKLFCNRLIDYRNIHIKVISNLDYIGEINMTGYAVPNLEILGTDMLFDIIGSEPSTLIVDYGTASKLMPINKDKVFLGGMVGPGLSTLNKSLFTSTEKLGDYLVSLPPSYVNYSTMDAINASTTFGEAFKVIGLFNKLKEDLKEPDMKMVVTGGDGEIISSAMKILGFSDFVYDPLVIFRGMAKILHVYTQYFGLEKGN